MTYLDGLFISLFSLIGSVALFLGTIRFGDHIMALFEKK